MVHVDLTVKAVAEQFGLVRILGLVRLHFYSRKFRELMVNQTVSDKFRTDEMIEKVNNIQFNQIELN